MPVFNLKQSNQPILVSFRFNIFRILNKRKIFVQAKIMPSELTKTVLLYVDQNANLLLELTEKQAQKYLMMVENDFGVMIEDLVIITNSKVKIEDINRK